MLRDSIIWNRMLPEDRQRRPNGTVFLNPTGERLGLADEIHVWQAWLDRDAEAVVRMESTLSPDEIARADRFRFEKDKNHYIVGRGLLRELLGNYLSEDPKRLEFAYGEYGKPLLAGDHASSGLAFNLSHSGGLAAYAFAINRNLGIDVEKIKPDFLSEDIARRYFSAREVDDLFSLSPTQRPEGFFRCWTRKEAYLKARGAGLQIPLDSFSVSLLPGQPPDFLGGVDPCWKLTAFVAAEGYPAAIAYDGAPGPLHVRSAGAQLRI
jgi:4'-phosphopantetheinyl transferase